MVADRKRSNMRLDLRVGSFMDQWHTGCVARQFEFRAFNNSGIRGDDPLDG